MSALSGLECGMPVWLTRSVVAPFDFINTPFES